MRLKIFSSILILGAGIYSFAAEEAKILSEDRASIFDLNEQKAIEDSAKLSKDWINPITYTYSSMEYRDSQNQDRTSVVAINQPIFKSGGIYRAIKYASSLRNATLAEVEIARKALIKDATTTLFEIHKIEAQIKKQEYLIKNSELDVQRKKEQVLSGVLDASYLDNALLDLNAKRLSLADLNYNKTALINKFDTLSDVDYKSLQLPKLELISQEEFISKNKLIQKQESVSDKDYQYSGMILAKYLPTVSAVYNYTKYHNDHKSSSLTALAGTDTQKYGLTVSMPLDIRALNDTQSAKIEYIKSKTQLNIVKDEENSFYKTKLASIKRAEQKLEIAKEELATYTSLVQQMEELSIAGLKTDLDFQTMKNSKAIKELDLDIFNYELQVELLELYARI
ncbi:MAG: TolC family protein [Arcobacteraceae bacterium]|jgi:outer membrane protein TolC|nr:TolC family protein [Arcobacteraceae bacterium]